MTDGIMLEAKKDGLRQTQDGLWKMSLTVKDMPAELLSAPMGQRLAVVIVALTDDEEKKPIFPGGYVDAPKSEGQKAVARAAMLCGNTQFQDWIRTAFASSNFKWSDNYSGDAAAFVRHYCQVSSRRDIAVNPDALDRFLGLEADFKFKDTRR